MMSQPRNFFSDEQSCISSNYKEREEKAFLGKCSSANGQLLICKMPLVSDFKDEGEIKKCPFPDPESASCIRF